MVVGLCYKSVAVAVMLTEINFCANRLQLPVKLPFEQRDIRKIVVFEPRGSQFYGRLDIDKYVFSFAKTGRLRFIINMDGERGNQPLRLYLEGLAKVPSILNAAVAYERATNWLQALDVDVQRLEKDHPATVKQQSFTSWIEDAKPSQEILLPIFDIKWGDWGNPVIDIQVSGSTGELLKLRQENISYSRRPDTLIKDVDELLAISDREFLSYSPSSRSNLIVRFAAINYPPQTPLLENLTNSVRTQ